MAELEAQVNDKELLRNLYFSVAPTGEKEQMRMQSFSEDRQQETKYFEVDKDYEVYLINDSKYDVLKLQMLAGGYASEDDGLIETSKTFKEFALNKKHALKLETLDFGMLDFVNWYHFDLWVNHEVLQLQAVINKAHALNEKVENKDVPILHKKGYVLPIDVRSGKPISQEIQEIDMGSRYHNFSKKEDTNKTNTNGKSNEYPKSFTYHGKEVEKVWDSFFDNKKKDIKNQKNRSMFRIPTVLSVVALMLILGFGLYWYQIRPSNTRSACVTYAYSKQAYSNATRNNYLSFVLSKTWHETRKFIC